MCCGYWGRSLWIWSPRTERSSPPTHTVSLLTPDGLSIYTQELELYHDMSATQGVRKLLQRSDGSVFLISAETARLYLPD